jgi:hypothetical protein
MMRLVTSPRYRDLWGDRFDMVKIGEQKIENNQTGWKFATSIGGIGTGSAATGCCLMILTTWCNRTVPGCGQTRFGSSAKA